MTVEERMSFDLGALKRAYEEWDIEGLLALYADDVELIQIDRDNPPSSPRVRRGKEVFKGMFVPGWSQGRRQLDRRDRGWTHRP